MTRSVILGLDASPKRIGWAVVDYDAGTWIAHGVSTVSGDDDLRARRETFASIAQRADRFGDVCAIIIEDAYVGVNRRGTITHAVSVGNVEAWASTRWPDQLVVRLAPTTWRKAIGVATVGKAAVMDWAVPQIGRVSQDEADAFGVAVAGHRLVWGLT